MEEWAEAEGVGVVSPVDGEAVAESGLAGDPVGLDVGLVLEVVPAVLDALLALGYLGLGYGEPDGEVGPDGLGGGRRGGGGGRGGEGVESEGRERGVGGRRKERVVLGGEGGAEGGKGRGGGHRRGEARERCPRIRHNPGKTEEALEGHGRRDFRRREKRNKERPTGGRRLAWMWVGRAVECPVPHHRGEEGRMKNCFSCCSRSSVEDVTYGEARSAKQAPTNVLARANSPLEMCFPTLFIRPLPPSLTKTNETARTLNLNRLNV